MRSVTSSPYTARRTMSAVAEVAAEQAGVAVPRGPAVAARARPAVAAGRKPPTRATGRAGEDVSLNSSHREISGGPACSDPTYTGKVALGSAGPRLATFRRLP